MKRLISLIVFSLVPLSASAQAQFPCYPSQVGGRGGPAFFEEDAAAKAYGWWCPSEWTGPELVLVSGPNTAFPTNWIQVALDLMSKSKAERTAAFTQHYKNEYPVVDGKLMVPNDVYPIHKKVWDQLQPLKPPTYVWSVAPNGTLATRPTYPMVNGVRGKVSNGDARINDPCDCTIRWVERTLAYCGVNNNATQLAVCRKK